MEASRLKDVLFDGRTNLFAVLDGVAVPDLPLMLHASGLPNFCLLSGELTPDMVHAAPYVVQLTPDNKFADTVFQKSFGKNWGVFAQTRFSMTEMRKHFRALLTVYTEDGRPMLFRFYDPRVLAKFLPTCNGGELKTLFGNVDAFLAEDVAAKGLAKFQIVGGTLEKTLLN